MSPLRKKATSRLALKRSSSRPLRRSNGGFEKSKALGTGGPPRPQKITPRDGAVPGRRADRDRAGQCAAAAATPMPVWERTYWASNAASSSRATRLRSVTENSQMPPNATIIENSAGSLYGKIAVS